MIAAPIFLALGYGLADIQNNADFLLSATLGGQILSIVLLLLLLRNQKIDVKTYLNFGKMTGKLVAIMFIAFVVAVGLVEVIGQALEIEPNSMIMDLIMNGNIVLVFLTLTIFAPISEELFFRGFLFKELEARYSAFVTITVTSITFSLSHALQYDLSEVGMVLLLAVVMGYLRYRWKNTYLPLGVHFLNNFASFLAFLYIY